MASQSKVVKQGTNKRLEEDGMSSNGWRAVKNPTTVPLKEGKWMITDKEQFKNSLENNQHERIRKEEQLRFHCLY